MEREYDVRLVSIVDDDGSLRRSIRNLLTSVGFRVETFDSAEVLSSRFIGRIPAAWFSICRCPG